MKNSFNACGITNLSCCFKASNADDKLICLDGEEEILVNDVEDMDDVMLNNILLVKPFS